MSGLASRWQQWSAAFAAFSLRERAITALTVIFGGGFLLFNYLVEPWQIKALSANTALLSVRAEIPQQEALLRTLKAGPTDPDAANRQRLAQLKEQLAAVSDWLKQFETSLVPPGDVPELLEGVLARNPKLELIGMKTVAPVPMSQATDQPPTKVANTGGPPGEGIFKHTIELSLAGSYNDLLNYVSALERLPQHLMLASANIRVESYPRTVLVLRVYTLSFDRNWLQI